MKDQKTSILLVENIHAVAKEAFEKEGFHVDMLTYAPTEDEIIKIFPAFGPDIVSKGWTPPLNQLCYSCQKIVII